MSRSGVPERAESPLRELCRGLWPAPDPEAESARREHIAGQVLALQRRLARQRRVRRRAAFASALAALLGGALALVLWLRVPAAPEQAAAQGEALRLLAGSVSLSQQQGHAALPLGPLTLAADELLVTAATEGAELRLASETALSVAPASRVGLERRARGARFEERVRLVAGRVALQVPRLGEQGKVLVETGDALVEVHGTRFSVRVVPQAGRAPFTEVEVQEGRVRVQGAAGERMLGAGARWSSLDLAAAQQPSSAPQVEGQAAQAEAAQPLPRRAERPRRPREPAPASELAAQNRLLEAAELARKNGLSQLSLRRLAELIERYPRSEHAHSARVTRFRLLRELGRVQQARAAAQEYLQQHPHGFAREEVEQWLRQP